MIRPGRFAVTTTGAAPANADLAFGGSIGNGITRTLLPALPLLILGFSGGLLLFAHRNTGRRAYA